MVGGGYGFPQRLYRPMGSQTRSCTTGGDVQRPLKFRTRLFVMLLLFAIVPAVVQERVWGPHWSVKALRSPCSPITSGVAKPE